MKKSALNQVMWTQVKASGWIHYKYFNEIQDKIEDKYKHWQRGHIAKFYRGQSIIYKCVKKDGGCHFNI